MASRRFRLKHILRKMPLFCLILLTTAIFSVIGLIGTKSFFSDFSRLDFRKEPFFAASVFGLKDYLNGDEEIILPTKMVKKEKTEDKTEIASKDTEDTELIPEEDAPTPEAPTIPEGVRLTIPDGVNSPVAGAADYGVADTSVMVDWSYPFNTDTEGIFAPNGYYRYLEQAADASYFSDALFIGDSRTVGLYYWGGMNEYTNFFCKESMSIFNVTSKELDYYGCNGEEGSTDLDTLLTTHGYGKIYLCLGINEMGRHILDYYNQYRLVVAHIRELQPNAIIYIQGNLHVAGPLSFTDSIFNNTNLVQRNLAIASLANGRDIFYIDANPNLCDGDGNLVAESTNDNIHMKAAYYPLWTEFLIKNTIDPGKEPTVSIEN